MKTLTFPIRSKGFIYNLIKREQNVVLTEQVSQISNTVVGYEITIVQTHRQTKAFNGKQMFEKGDEYLPGTNQWGKLGWTKYNLQDAEKKFQEVLLQQAEKG